MNATYLQKMIRLNAKQIAIKEAVVAMLRTEAKEDAAKGEKAFSIDAYKQADKYTRAKAKLVDIQKVLKAELATIHRAARIERKIAKIKAVLPNFTVVTDPASPDLTSREMEEAIDHCYDLFVPKKADTRPAA